jgi:hypothetical protein
MRQGLKARAITALQGLSSPRQAFRPAWPRAVPGIGLVLPLALASALAAQETPQRPRRPLPGLPGQDTTRPVPAAVPRAPVDTTTRVTARRVTPPDSAPADSVSFDSLRAIMPALGPPAGPLPSQRRIVFDKDAIRFSGALTLGELLRLVPGVQMVRLGWFGLPEFVVIAGQGAASLEIDVDGFRQDFLGTDSSGYDLGRFPIGMYSRVEIEVLPTVLRVHLVTEMTAIRRPLTEVSFSTGDVQTNAYRVRYLNRWASGLGIGAGFTYFGTAGPVYSLADIGELGLWFRGGWMTSNRAGLEYQFTLGGFDRERLTTANGATLPGVKVRRADSFVRAFASSRAGGMGWRLDALLGTSRFTDTAAAGEDAAVTQAALIGGYRGDRASVELSVRSRDDERPLELGLRASWSPFRAATIAAGTRNTWIIGGGALSDADVGAELRPVSFLRLHGDFRWRVLDDSVLTAVDTMQRVLDWGAGIGIVSRRWRVDVAYQWHGAFVAPVFGVVQRIVPVATGAEAGTVTLSWSLRPVPWLTWSGWYRHPLNDAQVALELPHHALNQLTFRSRFLPHFRRGIFEVMGKVELESWGRGLVGYDAGGDPVEVAGNSIWNVHLQFRLVGAVVYWTLRNWQLRRWELVRGYPMPRSLQRFGIMWEFTN